MVINFDKGIFLRRLEECLRGKRPGLEAQLKMVPNPRPGHQIYSEVEDTCLKAGVLILLYSVDDRFHLVLTRRTEKVERHQSQISFPGGRVEPEETPELAALRETSEELGTPSDFMRIVGNMTPLYIPPTNYCIYPFVALMDSRPQFNPSPFEVAEVLEIPLSHLLEPKTAHEETWMLHGREVLVPFYLFDGHKIWGATAMVLAEFLEMVSKMDGLK